jgi:hypothetical protein
MSIQIGVRYAGAGRCEFIVWEPQAHEVAVKLVSPEAKLIPVERDDWGYWRANVEGIKPGARYLYRISAHLLRHEFQSGERELPRKSAAGRMVKTGRFGGQDLGRPGSASPERIAARDELTIKGSSLALYRREEP